MEELFKTLQEDTQSLWQNPHGSVRRLRRMPSAATFFRDYVATSTPVIIEGGVSSWDAVRSWDLESLGRTNPELEVCSIRPPAEWFLRLPPLCRFKNPCRSPYATVLCGLSVQRRPVDPMGSDDMYKLHRVRSCYLRDGIVLYVQFNSSTVYRVCSSYGVLFRVHVYKIMSSLDSFCSSIGRVSCIKAKFETGGHECAAECDHSRKQQPPWWKAHFLSACVQHCWR